MDQQEHRSRVRITWRFWVAVEGVDDFPRLRFGNISTAGVYFETDRHIGDPGTVQWLHLAASEQGTPVEVMGRVLRLTRDTREKAATDRKGVAVEFMPEDAQTRAALAQLVREVATHKMQEEEGGEFGAPPAPATRKGPRVHRVQLETSLSMSVGQIVRVTIQTDEGDGTVQVRGRVWQVMPMTRLDEEIISRVSIQAMDTPPASVGGHAEPTRETTKVDLQFQSLVAAVHDDVDEEDLSSSGDLTGHLARVKLPNLLSFLERSRLSGELKLENDEAGRTASLFIDHGRILDVEADPPYATPRAALAQVVKWGEGTFHFVAGDIEREDRLQLSGKLLSK